MQCLIPYQCHPLFVLDGRDVVQCVFSKFDFEYVITFDNGELWQILDLAHELDSFGLFVKAEVDFVLFGHAVQHFSDKVFLEVYNFAFDETHGFVIDHQIISEVVLHMDFVGRTVLPYVPTLNVVVIENQRR